MVKEGFTEGPRYRMTPCARLCRKFFAILLMDNNAILSSAYLCRRAARKSDISCTRGCVDTRMDDRWTSDLGYGKKLEVLGWKRSSGECLATRSREGPSKPVHAYTPLGSPLSSCSRPVRSVHMATRDQPSVYTRFMTRFICTM